MIWDVRCAFFPIQHIIIFFHLSFPSFHYSRWTHSEMRMNIKKFHPENGASHENLCWSFHCRTECFFCFKLDRRLLLSYYLFSLFEKFCCGCLLMTAAFIDILNFWDRPNYPREKKCIYCHIFNRKKFMMKHFRFVPKMPTRQTEEESR